MVNRLGNKNIKMLVLMVVLILICSAGFIFLKGNNKTITGSKEKSQIVSGKESTIVGKNNNVVFEQNKYYKKYSITLKHDAKDTKWTEDGDNINIEVDGKSLSKIVMSSKDKSQAKTISFGDGVNGKIIKITKKCKENYVWNDVANPKIIHVMVSKIDKPYDYKVVVDPGHGGFDPGTNLKGIIEKNVTLNISKDLEKYLIYNGCKVLMTRNSDALPDKNSKNEKQDLRARCAIIANEKPDAAVSIHVNSFKDSKYSGITTCYYPSRGGTQSAQKLQLAKSIEKEVSKSDGWKSRGVFVDNLALTRPDIPCVLMECGFITNDGDRQRLTNNQALDNLANNISNGVVDFLNSQKK